MMPISAPRTAVTNTTNANPPTMSTYINTVFAMSTWPLTTPTTTSLFVSSNSSNTLRTSNAPKPQLPNQTPGSSPRPYTPTPFTNLSSDDNCDKTNQREKEKINKVQRREWRQLVEEGRKKKEDQSTIFCIRFLILFEYVMSERSLLQNNYFSSVTSFCCLQVSFIKSNGKCSHH